MTEKTKLRGWKSLEDGTRVEMTEAEAESVLALVEQSKQRIAEAYPDTVTALRGFIDADQRMRDLGWQQHCFGLEDGAKFCLVEVGSTGLFEAVYRNGRFHYDGGVRRGGSGVYWKLRSDLTPQEAERMAETSANNAAAAEAHMRAMANLAGPSFEDKYYETNGFRAGTTE